MKDARTYQLNLLIYGGRLFLVRYRGKPITVGHTRLNLNLSGLNMNGS